MNILKFKLKLILSNNWKFKIKIKKNKLITLFNKIINNKSKIFNKFKNNYQMIINFIKQRFQIFQI